MTPDTLSPPETRHIEIEHISFSQVALFEKCPAQWALERLYRVDAPPSDAMVKGRNVHEDIEWGLRAHIQAEYQAIHEYPESEAVVAWVKAQGIQVAPSGIEQTKSTSLACGVRFEARADLVTTGAVYDWKTSAKGWKKGAEKTKGQALAYAGVFDVPTVTFVIVTPDAQIDVRSVTPDSAKVSEYFDKVDQTVARMLAREYERKQGWGCNACPVRNVCKPWAHKGPITW